MYVAKNERMLRLLVCTHIFTTIDKFVARNDAVAIQIHFLEQPVDVPLHRAIDDLRAPDHLVDRRDARHQLVPRDAAVPVKIIQSVKHQRTRSLVLWHHICFENGICSENGISIFF